MVNVGRIRFLRPLQSQANVTQIVRRNSMAPTARVRVPPDSATTSMHTILRRITELAHQSQERLRRRLQFTAPSP